MERNRLSLDALHRHLGPEPPPGDLRLADLAASAEAVSVSRRELLGLAGVAAVALPPGGKALSDGLQGAVEVRHAGTRAALLLGGRERWVVDSRDFAGNPRLKVLQRDDLIEVSLTGARYPGTDLPADFTLRVTPGLLGRRVQIQMRLGGIRAEAPAGPWLAGHQVATGPARLGRMATVLGGGAGLVLEGSAEARLDRNWVLTLAGPRVARMEGAGPSLAADEVSLLTLDADAPSLMEDPPSRRSLVGLQRGDHKWSLAGQVKMPRGTHLRESGQAFDLLRVEAGETPAGARRCAASARSLDKGSLSVAPDARLRTADGDALELRLRGQVWARAFDDAGDHAALTADLATDAVWAHGDGWSARLCGGDGAGGLTVVAEDGSGASLRCEPLLAALAMPPGGALAEPAVPLEPMRVALSSSDQQVAQIIRPPRVPLPRPPQEEPAPAPAPAPTPAPAQPPIIRPDVTRPPRVLEQIRPPVLAVPSGPRAPAPDLDLRNISLDNFLFPVIRAGDMLALSLQFINLRFRDQTELVRAEADRPAYVIAHMPAQHVGEEAFLEQASPDPPPVKARLSGPSRLVFQVPAAVESIPYTLPALLDWSQFDLAVAPTALPPPAPPAPRVALEAAVIQLPRRGTPRETGDWDVARPTLRSTPQVIQRAAPLALSPQRLAVVPRIMPTPAAPTNLHTAIEAPYRLILSPNNTAGWVHATREVTHGGRTELWHTRLGVKGDGGQVYDGPYTYAADEDGWRVVEVSSGAERGAHFRALRAVWSPDYSTTLPPHADVPFRMSLTGRDRCELVWLTSDFTIPNAQTRIVGAHRFMLSALGVWMNVRYAADLPQGRGLSLEEWRHEAQMGRDQYVRVVYKGFLYPFGHPASLVKVTERKFERHGAGNVAYLRQRFFIVVRDPERVFPAHGQPNDARDMPLRRVTLTTLVTPSLDQAQGMVPGRSAQAAFWIRSGGQDLPFHVVGEDWDGHELEFTIPLVFVGVEDQVAFSAADMTTVASEYNKPANANRRRAMMFGQKVAFAASSADKPGDTTMETESITFRSSAPPTAMTATALEQAGQVRAYPSLEQAAARVPALAELAGQGGTVNISLHDTYITRGWDANANRGQVFMQLTQAAGFDFPPDVSGGMVTPGMSITALSRKFGPIGGDPSKLATGIFDPEDFFKDAKAKILGGIDLAKILQSVFGDAEVPTIKIRPIFPDDNPLLLPEAVEATLKWEPKVQEFTVFKPRPDCKLTLDGLLRTELTGTKASTYSITTTLTKFSVDLSVIIVRFNKLEFINKTGQKPKVDVDIDNVDFGGPLEFVNELRNYLRSGELGGVSIDITGAGVYAGFSLAIPNVAVGVMSLQNMKLAAGVTLPFSGDPVKLRFAFNERANPFLLTVSMFGGGGFFAMELLPDGLKMMEASFEFGGNFSLNIGIASGGAYLMAGVYFRLERNEEAGTTDVELTGYLRCGGHLSVLGLIRISAEFYMSLTYQTVGGRSRVWGQASLTVGIKILFFSKTVTMKVEREFAGSGPGQARSLDGVQFASALQGAQLLAQATGGAALGASAPPRIADVLSREDWSAYCEAFA